MGGLVVPINALMGSKPEARFQFIQERAAYDRDLDIEQRPRSSPRKDV